MVMTGQFFVSLVLFIAYSVLFCGQCCSSLSTSPNTNTNTNTLHHSKITKTFAQISVSLGLSLASTGLSLSLLPLPSHAAVESPKLERWLNARQELIDIDKNWDALVEKRGGDGVRVKLGTVYKAPACLPALCNFPSFIEKFLVANSDDIADLDAIDEPSKDLASAYQQAEFLAYSANFADMSGGGGASSADYLQKSRNQVIRAEELVDQILKLLRD